MEAEKRCRKCGVEITWREYYSCNRHCFLCDPPPKSSGREYTTTDEQDAWSAAIFRNER